MDGLLMKYFVLKPNGKDAYAQASRAAMRAYANAIEAVNLELADSLQEWVQLENAKANGEGQ